MAPSVPRILLCPGQGAQFVGMGKAWYDRSPEARAIFDAADAQLAGRLGDSLTKLCFEGPADRLNQTDVSQPAIYVASVASFRGLLAAWGAGGAGAAAAKEAGLVSAAGLSLGEYTALHLAGVFTFEDGLELVTLRGRAMQDAADAIRQPDGTPGSGMVAIIGADEAQVNELCQRARLPREGDADSSGGGGAGGGTGIGADDVLVPANFNAPGQIVISGSIAACKRAVAVAGDMGLRATALPVAGAFHSSLMAPAAKRLEEQLTKTSLRQPACPVLSNVTGEPHAPAGGLSIESSIRKRLVEQLTSPVRWEQDCRWLASKFAPNGNPAAPPEFHELAPGKTLAGLFRRIDKAVKVEAHDEPAAPAQP